jgi:hypothetical protein
MLKTIIKWWLFCLIIYLPFQSIIGGYITDWSNSLKYAVRFLEEFTIVIFLILAIREYWNKQEYRKPSYLIIAIPIVIFILVGFLSGIINSNSPVITALGIFEYIKNFLLIFVSALLVRDIDWFKKIFRALFIIALFLSIIAVFEEVWALVFRYLLGKDILDPAMYLFRDPPSGAELTRGTWRLGMLRVRAININPNLLGMLYLFVLTIYLYTVRETKKLLIILLSVGLLLTFSKMAYAGLLFLAVIRKLKERNTVIAFTLIALIFITFVSTTSFISDDALFRSDFPTYRDFARHKAFEVWKDYPVLGAGPGMFGGVISRMSKSPLYEEYGFPPGYLERFGSLDQYWPQLFAETGLIGVIAFVALLLALMIVLFTASARGPDREIKQLSKSLLVFIPIIYIYTMGTGFGFTEIIFTFFIFVGICAGSSLEQVYEETNGSFLLKLNRIKASLLEHLQVPGIKLILFFTLIFLLKLIYLFNFGLRHVPDGTDSLSYNGYAMAILHNHDWLTNPDFTGDYRPPIYPLFIALIYSIFGVENIMAVYFFQAILSTLTVYYIYRLSACLFGERSSFLSLLWAGFYVFYYIYLGAIVRESLVIFLVVVSFYYLWKYFEDTKKTHFIENIDLWRFVLAFSLLLHADARYLFYIPFLSLLFVFYDKFHAGILKYSAVLGILILLLVPWSIRNYVAYGGFVLINTRTLDTTSEDLSKRIKQFGINKDREIKNENYPSDEEREFIKSGGNPINRLPEEVDIIKRDIYAPSTVLGKKLYYFKEMWIPFRFWWDYSPLPNAGLTPPWSLKHNIFSMLFYGILVPFVFFGIYHLFRIRHKALWFLVFPIILSALLHFLMWGRDRYRIHIDAFIIILGCYGIIAAYHLIKERKNSL